MPHYLLSSDEQSSSHECLTPRLIVEDMESDRLSNESARSVRSVTSRISSYMSLVSETVNEAKHRIPGYKESAGLNYQCCEQTSYKACILALTVPMVDNFAKGCIVKFLLELVLKRSFGKVLRSSLHEIGRFGLVTALTATTFHSVLCLLRRLGKSNGHKYVFNLGRRIAIVLAAMASSVPLYVGLQPNEQNLIKLIFFPLAFRCVVATLTDCGFKQPKHAEIYAYFVIAWFTGWAYT